MVSNYSKTFIKKHKVESSTNAKDDALEKNKREKVSQNRLKRANYNLKKCFNRLGHTVINGISCFLYI